MVQLMQGDCLELMKQIPDGSVDMVLCDLPYGVTDCKWDSVLPFNQLWEQYRRIVKSNGVIALFGVEPFSSKLRMPNLDLYKYDLVWKKNTCSGFLHAKNKPLSDYELISVFSPGVVNHLSASGGRRMTYNPQGVTDGGVVKQRSTNRERCYSNCSFKPREEYRANRHFPRMVIEFPNCKEKIHPTQKPVPLLEYLIKTYSNPGEVVLDNTMGSGSTGVAAVNTGRDFIGMELDPGYFEVAQRRINEAVAANG